MTMSGAAGAPSSAHYGEPTDAGIEHPDRARGRAHRPALRRGDAVGQDSTTEANLRLPTQHWSVRRHAAAGLCSGALAVDAPTLLRSTMRIARGGARSPACLSTPEQRSRPPGAHVHIDLRDVIRSLRKRVAPGRIAGCEGRQPIASIDVAWDCARPDDGGACAISAPSGKDSIAVAPHQGVGHRHGLAEDLLGRLLATPMKLPSDLTSC